MHFAALSSAKASDTCPGLAPAAFAEVHGLGPAGAGAVGGVEAGTAEQAGSVSDKCAATAAALGAALRMEVVVVVGSGEETRAVEASATVAANVEAP